MAVGGAGPDNGSPGKRLDHGRRGGVRLGSKTQRPKKNSAQRIKNVMVGQGGGIWRPDGGERSVFVV